MTAETKKQGGARPGAGRKAQGAAPKQTTSISLDPDVLDEARRLAEAKGVSLSAYVEELLRHDLY